jgi:hypothetical protein
MLAAQQHCLYTVLCTSFHETLLDDSRLKMLQLALSADALMLRALLECRFTPHVYTSFNALCRSTVLLFATTSTTTAATTAATAAASTTANNTTAVTDTTRINTAIVTAAV